MKTNNKKTTLPKSYDAGVCEAGKSIGFHENLTPEQVRSVFSKHMKIMHIETPAGFFLRHEPETLTTSPYNICHVISNLHEMDRQLRKFAPKLEGGPGWVRGIIQDILRRGIAPELIHTVAAANKLAEQGRLCVYDIKPKRLHEVKSANDWNAASINGEAMQINLQR